MAVLRSLRERIAFVIRLEYTIYLGNINVYTYMYME